MTSTLLWLPAGRQFDFADMVFWRDKGAVPFEHMAGRTHTIVLGPHASAAFPAELQPFVAPALTRRKQFDYSDVTTSLLGRAWAQADPGVVFIENPHSRLVMDPNRAPVSTPLETLREFFGRLARQRAGEPDISFGGVDAVRPITFSGEPVLLEPADDGQWAALGQALTICADSGPRAYFAACREAIDQVLASKAAGAPLLVISLHDTMNTKMRPDGAIAAPRPAADRLPEWVNFGNRGDTQGAAVGDEAPTLAPEGLRSLAAAWARSLDARPEGFTLNAPYRGAYETVHWGQQITGRDTPANGVVQVEFRREALLGPKATAHLQAPGDDWPLPDPGHIDTIVRALVEAGNQWRGR